MTSDHPLEILCRYRESALARSSRLSYSPLDLCRFGHTVQHFGDSVPLLSIQQCCGELLLTPECACDCHLCKRHDHAIEELATVNSCHCRVESLLDLHSGLIGLGRLTCLGSSLVACGATTAVDRILRGIW